MKHASSFFGSDQLLPRARLWPFFHRRCRGMTEKRRKMWMRLRKADLVDEVLRLERLVDEDSTFGVTMAMRHLEESLGDSMTPSQRVDLAAAKVLARTLDTGPELPQAGISKQLADLVGRLEPDEEEGGFLDELRRRREQQAGGADPAERTGSS